MKVKCPLFQEYETEETHHIPSQGVVRECWEEECAWWDKEEKCCVVLSIARRLKQVQVSVAR